MRPHRHRPLGHLLRAFLALFALVTAAAPAAAAVGEGVLAARGGRSPAAVHVEDARRARCPYVHADDCVLCAVLAVHALPAAVRAATPDATTACHVVRAHAAPVRVSGRTGDVRHARGPPTG